MTSPLLDELLAESLKVDYESTPEQTRIGTLFYKAHTRITDIEDRLTTALARVAQGDAELTAANAALAEARAETERYKSYYDLWYFVMDEAPLAFEEIVKTCSPASWMGAAQHLKKQRESK